MELDTVLVGTDRDRVLGHGGINRLPAMGRGHAIVPIFRSRFFTARVLPSRRLNRSAL